MKEVKSFAQLPKNIQESIREALKTKHEAEGDLGTEASTIEQARRLAAEAGYVCKPSRTWVQRLKADILNVGKRPYG